MIGAHRDDIAAPRQAQRVDAPLGPTARMLASIGIGCYLGWQTIDISPTLFPQPLPGVAQALGTWGYAATAILLCLLFALGAAAKGRTDPLVRHRGILALSCLGPALGTALLYLFGWTAEQAFLPGVVTGRLLFATSAGLVVLWGEQLALCGAAHMLACVAGGYALSFGICLIEANLSAAAAMLFRPVLPLLSGAALLALRNEGLPGHAERSVASHGFLPATGIKPFIATGALGAVFIAANHLSETKTDVSTELYTLIAGIFTSLAILALAHLTQKRVGGFSRLYRLITPLVIGCLLLTLALEPGSQRYEALAIGGSWAFFRVFTWTLWARIGERDPRGGAFVFALGQILLTACSTAGELLCTVLDLSALPLVATAAAIIGITVLVSVFLLDDGDVIKQLEIEGAQPDEDALEKKPEPFDPKTVTLEQLRASCRELPLSEREQEIALLILQGNDNAQACSLACITESTLRTHLRNMYAKTGTHSKAELVELLESTLQG